MTNSDAQVPPSAEMMAGCAFNLKQWEQNVGKSGHDKLSPFCLRKQFFGTA